MDHSTSQLLMTMFAWQKKTGRKSRVFDNEMITSFENPNYHLIDDDAINSNIPTPLSPQTAYYQSDTIYHDIITNTTNTTTNSTSNISTAGKKRRNYNQIDLNSMGIDDVRTPDSECSLESRKSSDFSSNLRSDDLDTSCTSEESDSEESDATPEPKRTSFLEFYSRLGRTSNGDTVERHDTQKEEEEEDSLPPKRDEDSDSREERLRNCINSPDSNDSGIQADEPKQTSATAADGTSSGKDTRVTSSLTTSVTSDESYKTACSQLTATNGGEEVKEVKRRSLPPGWEKHEDDDGAYYWHVKSGTIQRETPTRSQRPVSITNDMSLASALTSLSSPTTSSVPDTPSSYSSAHDPDHLSEFEGHAFKYASESMRNLYTGEDDESPTSTQPLLRPVRFAVRSLGWLQIAEDELTPERSSKAVNRCIMDLSLGRNDLNDAVGRWGDGKDLYMHLSDEFLSLVDPQDGTVLNKQNIQSIRVWGVGRDNGRDFAYVARDRLSRKHMCHVFRCDTPARHIANALRDICRKLMAERTHRLFDPDDGRNVRPTNLPNLEKHGDRNGQKITFQNLYKRTSFPTPMEEPRKVLRAHYLGSTPVPRPGGVEMLNTAMEEIFDKTPSSQWTFVNVAVAPSTITIAEPSKPDIMIAECRVRFLSFMGIAMNNAKLCAFIMHTAADTFTAHIFHSEPSAGNMCKTIEAACKLRYQKCLDAHHPNTTDHSKTQQAKLAINYLRTGMQSVFGRMKGWRTTNSQSECTSDSTPLSS